jgi:phosphoribosylformylglycinamidine synthase
MTMAGGLGLDICLADVPLAETCTCPAFETILFSESPGRFIVTIARKNREKFESLFAGMAASCVGSVSDRHDHLKIFNGDDQVIVDLSVAELDNAFNTTFGDRI